MNQYEIWWAELPQPVGRRPVMLLSRSGAYEYLSRVIVVEITSTIRRIPQELLLGRREGLPVRSVANFDNVHVVAVKALREKAGRLTAGRETEAKRALGYALGWAELVESLSDV